MSRALGYHLVKSTYGQWLPGDEQIGYLEPHMLHPGDPVRQRMAEERMRCQPLWMTDQMMTIVRESLAECADRSDGDLTIDAVTIESTHFHLLIPCSGRDINKTAKWLADQTAKAIHCRTSYRGPVWCKGKWCTYVFERSHWDNSRVYIERHNARRHAREKASPHPL
jgi:hypothetical protein